MTMSKSVSSTKCVDIEAISILRNPVTISDATTTSTSRLFDHLFADVAWSELKTTPTECFLAAACAFGCHKNPECWTRHSVDEILRLAISISQTCPKTECGIAESDKIVGMHAFDNKTAVHIRVDFYEVSGTEQTVSDSLKTTLAGLFKRYRSALLSTECAKITVWKQANRFYLFHCQPVDTDGRLTQTGVPKGALKSFINLDELCTFLNICFGDCVDLQNSLKIHSVEIHFAPLENAKEQENSVGLTNTCSTRWNGPLCQCSWSKDEHVKKHVAMSIAAILMSMVKDMMAWTGKTLLQIETIGKNLYDDAVIVQSDANNVTIDRLPRRIYMDHIEYKLIVSDNKMTYTLDEPSLTEAIADQLNQSTCLYVSMEKNSFSLIKKGAIFYWYDPNGVNDKEGEIRSSVCCFSDVKLLSDHILQLGLLLQSTTFEMKFIRIQNN